MPQKLDLSKREVWRKKLQDFERGNTTVVEFCRRTGAPVSSFYYWRQRLQSGSITAVSERQRNGTATRTRKARSVHRPRHTAAKSRLKFVPIQITGSRHAGIEVHLPNGTRVTVPCEEHDAISAVIAALLSNPPEHRPC